MAEFSPPLSRLCTDIDEIWTFEHGDDETRVIRTFRLHARSAFTRPLVWAMSFLLKRAIIRNLRQMRAAAIAAT